MRISAGRFLFMHALLNANGYYAPSIKDTVIFKIAHKGSKVKKGKKSKPGGIKVRFNLVVPGKQMVFDSVGFSIGNTGTATNSIKFKGTVLIKVGAPYSQTGADK